MHNCFEAQVWKPNNNTITRLGQLTSLLHGLSRATAGRRGRGSPSGRPAVHLQCDLAESLRGEAASNLLPTAMPLPYPFRSCFPFVRAHALCRCFCNSGLEILPCAAVFIFIVGQIKLARIEKSDRLQL
jgi:hypothetical protein